jgi:cytochrome c peroxidase
VISKAMLVLVFSLGALAASGQSLGSLKRVSVPQPIGIEPYVRDKALLVALGKALFWDSQAGSDGKVACATCHFHAGADHRSQNQMTNLLGPFPVNHALVLGDFPLHVLANYDDNRSAVLVDSSAVVGSAGLLRRIFTDVANPTDDGFDTTDDAAFSLGGANARRVTRRNTSTVINAVFNVRNFWDGRASNLFTGFTPFGDSDANANSLVLRDGQLALEKLRIDNASLASQAVGPPLNNIEMSYDGRTWPKLGKKMLGLRPLAQQFVAPDDSVLGPFSNPAGRGLASPVTYLSMIQAAFQPEYWSSDRLVNDVGIGLGKAAAASGNNTNEFTQAEFNFALFWGLAIQAYEATLVSDDSPFDRFSEGFGGTLSLEQQNGLNIFLRAECNTCHGGPEFTTATFTGIAARGTLRGGRNGGLDTGFFRTGVRPASEDIGLAADDDFGRPLSIAVVQNANAVGIATGAFKTPTLRNVELTGPYFHNGGLATLEQVVDFYNRGSDFPGGNVGPDIRRLNLSVEERRAVTAFLKSLTDDRVRFERAPFDHPELCVPIGQIESAPGVLQLDSSDPRFLYSAADRWAAIPAVGQMGNPVPLQTFEELLSGIGRDGSRAHTLTETCQ